MPVMMITKIMAFADFGHGKKRLYQRVNRLDDELGTASTISFDWLSQYPPQLIYRAVCILCLQSLIFLPICYLAYLVHLPDPLYTSPLERIFQNGQLFYTISLYTYTKYNNELRFTLFTPWPPALGIIGNLYFLLALQETDKKWRWIGIVAGIAMCAVSTSRLAILSLPGVSLVVWIMTNFWRPTVQMGGGILFFVSGIFSSLLLRVTTDFKDAFLDARSESTKVRKALIDVAFERSKEAPIWGHGTQEPSPKALEHMPIGSHTTWGGLMFVHGLAGLVAFLVPMLCTFIELLIKAQKSTMAKVGLSVLLVLVFFSSGENIDSLAYLCWPAWVIIGIALKESVQSPSSVIDNRETASTFL
jgi:hypothetical protein